MSTSGPLFTIEATVNDCNVCKHRVLCKFICTYTKQAESVITNIGTLNKFFEQPAGADQIATITTNSEIPSNFQLLVSCKYFESK